MSLIDSVLNLITKQPKDLDAPKPPVGSRSEREAKLKDKAGMVISVFALLLAVNAWYGGKLSSTVLNSTLGANNTWAQYQAKAGRGVSYEIAAKTTAYQLAIVVLSASILAVSMGMFWGSFAVAAAGILLSLNGLYLWF